MTKNLETRGIVYLPSDRVRIPKPILDGFLAGSISLPAFELSVKLAARRSEEVFQARLRRRSVNLF